MSQILSFSVPLFLFLTGLFLLLGVGVDVGTSYEPYRVGTSVFLMVTGVGTFVAVCSPKFWVK